jgi:YVTN family beta-propeller protein
VINGATNATTTVQAGTSADELGINARTNKVYVADRLSSSITVIDGKTNGTVTIPVGSTPDAVAVDELRNKIYVLDSNNGNIITTIDGATNATSSVPTNGQGSIDLAVNVLTNQLYVLNNSGSNVSLFSGAAGVVPPALLHELISAPNALR